MTINEWVKKIRQEAALSIRDVSEQSGFSAAAIYRYEDGSRKVSLGYIQYWIERGYEPEWEMIKNENRRYS